MTPDCMKIELSWDDPKGVSSPELAATWAKLGIRIRELVPTTVLDRRAQTIRHELYLPTYPLAEWIACNWFPILHESMNPRRGIGGWLERHALRSGREGFAVPPLHFSGDGQTVQITCKRLSARHEPVEFLAEGSEELPTNLVRDKLSEFVSLTAARLSAKGIEGTRLQEEWLALQELDSEEQAFCIAAAQLGQDPFSLSEESAAQIVNAEGLLPREMRTDFFDSTTMATLADDTQAILGHTREIAAKRGTENTLTNLRSKVRAKGAEHPPWRRGYEQAQRLRSELGATDSRFSTWSSLLGAFGLDESWRRTCLVRTEPTDLFDSLAGPSRMGSPVFVVPKHKGDAAQRFAFCRALAGFMESGSWTLANASHNARQKQNRAFAAELLAPAEQIRKALATEMVDDETVSAVAQEFGVSEYVLRHQVVNHQIAELCGTLR